MFFPKSKSKVDDDQFDWIPQDPQAAKGGEHAHGPRVLKAQATPLVSFIASLLVCLFWNGILSVFISFSVKGFLRGDPEWFWTLFLIPFLLVGLALVAWVLHSFLALFNPRPVVTMLTPELWLGGRIDVRWHFSGNASRIRRLQIHLEGQERATYRHGTTTHTDTETFAKIELTDTTAAGSISAGQASANIPLRTMHSFEASKNEIVWSLLVEGDIAWWPNVSQRFMLVVLPAPAAE